MRKKRDRKYIVSLKDIAKETGVSVSTVSRVIKKKGEIALATRERVTNAAKQLGYHSNLLIEGMKTGKTKTIGVIVPISNDFFRDIVINIHQRLISKGYLPINIWSDSEGKQEQQMISRLIEQRVEGIIIQPILDWVDTDYFSDAIAHGLPVITLDRKIPAAVDFVGTDDYLGGKLAAEHFVKLGHRKIAYYQGPQLASPALLRRRGFEDFLKTCPEIDFRLCGGGEWQDHGVDLVAKFLSENRDITAIAAFNDIYGTHIYDAAFDLGIKIPEELSVIGFGALKESQCVRPSMTTFQQFPEKIAKTLVDSIFSRIKYHVDDRAVREVKIKPELVTRNSTRTII